MEQRWALEERIAAIPNDLLPAPKPQEPRSYGYDLSALGGEVVSIAKGAASG